ncbi:MAG: gamma-glutamyltransferase [Geminicoccaceae bacterium]
MDGRSGSGARAITVPGAAAGWQALLDAHGTRSMEELLQPAIAFATEGFIVTPRVAFDWQRAVPTLKNSEAGRQYYLPSGKAPGVGDRMTLPLLGETLRTFARDGLAVLLRGRALREDAREPAEFGGLHEGEDFQPLRARMDDTPISTDYRGLNVLELPPNGHGITALEMLHNILENFALGRFDPRGALFATMSRRRPHASRSATATGMSPTAAPCAERNPGGAASVEDTCRLAGSIDPARAMAMLPEYRLDPHPRHDLPECRGSRRQRHFVHQLGL